MCSYQQCELLTAHYKQPVLLIEFDEKKSFNIEVRHRNRDYRTRPH